MQDDVEALRSPALQGLVRAEGGSEIDELPRETVIVVHGTWAGLRSGTTNWWFRTAEADGNAPSFTAKLDEALEKRGSRARCWAHCDRNDQVFHWSPGANSWIERTRAAAALADYVAELQSHGWICHLIGHSHGGNVVIEAALANAPLGNLVTLGTPFLDTMSPIRKRSERLTKVLSRLAEAGMLLIGLLSGIYLSLFKGLNWRLAALFYLACLSLVLIVAGAHKCRRTRRARSIAAARSSHTETLPGGFSRSPSFHTPLLALGCPTDEAWQVLHHLATIDNPLAIRSGPIRYLLSSLRSQMSHDAQVAHIQGAKTYADVGMAMKFLLFVAYLSVLVALVVVIFIITLDPDVLTDLFGTARRIADILTSVPGFPGENSDAPRDIAQMLFLFLIMFPVGVLYLLLDRGNDLGPDFYSAFLSPLRWCARLSGALMSIPFQITTYVVRRKGWPVLLRIAMGLDGYPFPIPKVERFPEYLPDAFVKYEDIPLGAQQRAMDERSAWVARHLGDVSRTFANLAITSSDVSTLLRTIEQDQTLVHAAYYTDDECIGRIADWIAGKG
ncbi:hypothetical protein ACM41_15065 [Bradyrhizobium sp. CCBAU 21362]|uniref:hypothetical protein n=1 Tax=Bradyrhizobium sp. CCBAU 21362 TaxID=1325082 RepID=UPI002306DA29|nr:hypothetical protein [Bradyrhizobium sp. CCBAU 21362]MDA9537464.1 hypothetical protein [Bradyrhizobium sp. CCBAU 21362]